MFCVGLIGSLASGKSTAAAYFASLGAKVINADTIAKELTMPNQPAYAQIIQHFGKGILTDTKGLNRQQLRRIIFKYPQERLWLEELLHPLIRQQIQLIIQQSTKPYCMIEIPLLSDKNQYPYLNRILFIKTDLTLQIKRFIKRDNSTEEDARAILSTQIDKTKLKKLANDVIENNGSLHDFKQKIMRLHKTYLTFANKNSYQ